MRSMRSMRAGVRMVEGEAEGTIASQPGEVTTAWRQQLSFQCPLFQSSLMPCAGAGAAHSPQPTAHSGSRQRARSSAVRVPASMHPRLHSSLKKQGKLRCSRGLTMRRMDLLRVSHERPMRKSRATWVCRATLSAEPRAPDAQKRSQVESRLDSTRPTLEMQVGFALQPRGRQTCIPPHRANSTFLPHPHLLYNSSTPDIILNPPTLILPA